MLSLILAAALLTDPVATPVTLASEPAALHGTLLTPDGPTRAAALIIAGSGPTDRDGNNPLVKKNNSGWYALKECIHNKCLVCGSTAHGTAKHPAR
jgi:hypothetical protein